MLNFYVILAGHDKITDAGRTTNCKQKPKAAWLPTKFTKKCRTFRKQRFQRENSLKISDEERDTKYSTLQKHPVEHPDRKYDSVFWQLFNYCRSYKINSLGPKRLLKTQNFEKKATFPLKKIFWPNLSRIIEHNKRQGTTYKST